MFYETNDCITCTKSTGKWIEILLADDKLFGH